MLTDGDPRRCPFVRLVAAGRLEEARQLALAGPEPAEEAVVGVLVGWARKASEGLSPEEFLAEAP